MASFNVMALDRNFNLVTPLKCINLQWSRKYHESGTFSLQIPLNQYDPSFKYIYTKSRPETGKIIQINYIRNNTQTFIQLSGYFLENELNRMVAFVKGDGNIIEDPDWVENMGNAEDVAYNFFNAFSQIKFKNDEDSTIDFKLGIDSKPSLGRGSVVQHTRDNSYLGNKIYHILKSSGMSYRVLYDFEVNETHFEVWLGKDRTNEQTENNPVSFSTRHNIKNPNVLLNNSTYKSGCIVMGGKNSGEESTTHIRALLDLDEQHEDNAFLFLQSQTSIDDFENLNEYYQVLDSEGRSEKNSNWIRTLNVEFDALVGSYEYMQDFDIGDICNLEIPEVGISANIRLIGCYEVIKSGSWSLTMEFGTPILKNN